MISVGDLLRNSTFQRVISSSDILKEIILHRLIEKSTHISNYSEKERIFTTMRNRKMNICPTRGSLNHHFFPFLRVALVSSQTKWENIQILCQHTKQIQSFIINYLNVVFFYLSKKVLFIEQFHFLMISSVQMVVTLVTRMIIFFFSFLYLLWLI
jgi:hypothetical protein